MRMASMRESRDSDRFLVNTHVQSHALLRRGFGTSVPFIIQGAVSLHNSVGQTKIIHCYKVSSLEFHRDNHASSVNINTAVFSKHNCVSRHSFAPIGDAVMFLLT